MNSEYTKHNELPPAIATVKICLKGLSSNHIRNAKIERPRKKDVFEENQTKEPLFHPSSFLLFILRRNLLVPLMLSLCSFHLIFFTLKFRIQIGKELNWRLLSHLTDVTLNAFLNAFRIFSLTLVRCKNSYGVHFTLLLLCSAHFFFLLFIQQQYTSDPIQIRFVWFCELFKCIHRMNKMLYYDKGMNNRNVVRIVWRHDFNNVNGSFAGNKK